MWTIIHTANLEAVKNLFAGKVTLREIMDRSDETNPLRQWGPATDTAIIIDEDRSKAERLLKKNKIDYVCYRNYWVKAQ